jgi:hypothetical protein
MVKVWILGWNVLKTCRSPDRSSALDAVTSRNVFQWVTQISYHPCHAGFALRYFSLFFTAWRNLCFPYLFRKKFRYVRGIHLRFPEIFPPNFCGPPVMSGLISPQSLLRFISAINHSLVHQLQQIWSNHIHPGLADATKNPWEFFTALGSRSIESSINFHRRPSNPLQTARAPAWWAIWASPSDRVATAGHRSAEAPGRATHGAPLPLMLHRLWMCWSKNGDGIPPKKMRDRGMIN